MASEPPAKKAKSDPEAEKKQVGFAAVDRYVTSGMVVGLDDTPIQIFTYLSLAAIAILLYQGLTI